MSADNRQMSPRRGSKNVDENGVPTIPSSIPLVLLGFGLFIGVPLMALEIVRTLRAAATGVVSEGGKTFELADDYRRLLWGTGAVDTVILGWACLTAYHFFSRRSKAPRMLIALYFGMIALNVAVGVWSASFALDRVVHLAGVIRYAALSSIAAGLWSIYLWRSKTVKRVFVYPLTQQHESAPGPSESSGERHV
ncbi:MAG: DUF2569 family protein [Planctomycetaceae bacterium]|nr:DUF2569 family protein [Planctomycetaceae bacterium]